MQAFYFVICAIWLIGALFWVELERYWLAGMYVFVAFLYGVLAAFWPVLH